MTETTQREALPACIDKRYDVQSLLGQGGMARVYRVRDSQTGQLLALKQLSLPQDLRQAAAVSALFEHEFRTLAQLTHPRVIAVHEFGIDAGSSYYTMELLDGGDLRDRAPLPWRELCGFMFDVCSSLALLHSRRLLHRDITPRNVRCTQAGRAKLIDFGAMVPIGTGGAQVVGTPAFTAPETLHRLVLDARADLFSLGATCYFALTGHLPYPGRTFAEVRSAWGTRPLPPSTRVPGIPPALDDLVLGLLHVEPALRPPSASEVMQRLAGIAGLDASESSAVSRAYLSTPALVGRDTLLGELRERISNARRGHGGGVLVRAAAGMGRSRVLDTCALDAMTQGLSVLRTAASGNQAPFTLVRALLQVLLAAHPSSASDFPELFAPLPNAPDAQEAEALQQMICRCVLTLSRSQALLLAVDDVQRIDSASASVLAALIDRSDRGRLLVLLTAATDSESSTLATGALARRCQLQVLSALTRDETQHLLASVFGDVPNIGMLADEIQAVAAGNPRACMDLAQHLVDRAAIKYSAGIWSLPKTLCAEDLPRSVEAALCERIATLSPAARSLAQAQALAYYEVFTLAQYRALAKDTVASEVDQAVAELFRLGALTSDGATYTFANRLWSSAFAASLEPAQRSERHAVLADAYEGYASIARVHHLFAAGSDERALAELAARHQKYDRGFDHKSALDSNVTKFVPSYAIAVRTAQRLGRSPLQINALRRWFVAASVTSEGNEYWLEAPAWRAQLEHDTGLDLWRADTQPGTALERLTRALTAAQARYLALPEAERVTPVDQALKHLAEYVVCSIAIGARTHHGELLRSLPALLEPFTPLSPILDAIYKNSLSTVDGIDACRYERARARWQDVLQQLDAMSGTEMQHIEAIRNAISHALGMMEVQMGLASAVDHAARLDHDPFQRVSALSMRRVVRLQQGDTAGAEQLRRQAEILALQQSTPQMFHGLLEPELTALAKLGDLAGMQPVIEHLQALARLYPTMLPMAREAEARFELVRGDFPAASKLFEACIADTAPDADGFSPLLTVWLSAHAGLGEAWLALDEVEAARVCASRALDFCEQRELTTPAQELARVLALAEGRAGEFAAATARLEALIANQMQRGETGLSLGLSLEARAQIAIWSEDSAAFAHYSRLTAREYRHGARSPLGARYERLVHEAQRHGFHAAAQLSDFESTTMVDAAETGLHDVHVTVLGVMAGAQRLADRARRALRLLCETRAATGGHLFGRSGDKLQLLASHGSAPVPASLLALAHEYLRVEEARSETMTVFATGTQVADEDVAQTTVQLAGVTYELLLLSCVVDGQGVIAGAAAIACGEQRLRHAKQGQLLSALAAQLVQAGDAG